MDSTPGAGELPTTPRMTLVAVRVAPLWKMTVPRLTEFPSPPICRFPEIFNTGFPDDAKFNVPVLFFALSPPTYRLPQTALVVFT